MLNLPVCKLNVLVVILAKTSFNRDSELSSKKLRFLYIHNNPVAEQIVEYPEEYWYSSARNYAGRENLLEVRVIAEAFRI